MSLYGSVNGLTKETTKLYGSVGLLTSFTASEGASTGGISGFFYPVTFVSKLLATDSSLLVQGLVDFDTCVIKISRSTFTGVTPIVYYDGTTTPVTNIPIATGISSTDAETYGVHLAGSGTIEYVVSDAVYTPSTKKIKKLYGSANGVSELIFEDNT